MHAIAHGIDMVEVSRIAEMRANHPDRFVERCFTKGEQDYCLGRKREAEHLAARFAAKEAVLKALDTGLAQGMSWTDIEIVRGAMGVPAVHLSAQAALRASECGIDHWLVSLSHTQSHAIASVIGMGNATGST